MINGTMIKVWDIEKFIHCSAQGGDLRHGRYEKMKRIIVLIEHGGVVFLQSLYLLSSA